MQKKESLGSSFSLERTAADFYPATTACELLPLLNSPRSILDSSAISVFVNIGRELEAKIQKTLLILTRGVLYSPSSIPSRVHPSVQPC